MLILKYLMKKKLSKNELQSKGLLKGFHQNLDRCHQYMFDTYIVHKDISYFEENKPDEVTKS